jgi:hypothetical protein
MNIWDVFISHASEENEVLQPLVKELELKFSIWYDADQILTGENFEKVVKFGLEYSAYAIVFFSPYYFLKEFTQQELDSLIKEHKKKIFPIAYKVSIETIKTKVPSLKGHKILEIKDISELKINQIVSPINLALKNKDPITELIDHDDLKNIMLDDYDFDIDLIPHPNTRVIRDGKPWEKCVELSSADGKMRIKSCAYWYPSIKEAIAGFESNHSNEIRNAPDGRLYDPNVGEQQYALPTFGDDGEGNGGLVVFRTSNILARVEYYSQRDYRYNYHDAEKYAQIIDKRIRFLISKRLLSD